MGYECPVCTDPQADAGHLANHLAFTAMTSGGDHEAWLDERVPGWDQLGEAELAAEVTDHAEEAEFPQVFEESGVEEQGHSHDHDLPPGADQPEGRDLSDDDAEVLAEARDLTKAMLEETAADADDAAEGASEDETQ